MRAIGKTFSVFALTSIVAIGCERSDSQYLALGDSYTCGQSVSPDDRWPVQLAALLKRDGHDLVEPTIIAGTGWTTADLATAMDHDGVRGKFDLVTLLVGVNNEFRGRDPQEYRREFTALLHRSIALTGGRASHVIVLSIPDWGVTPYAAGQDRKSIARSIDAFNAINRAESQTLGVCYVNVTPESRAAATRPALLADDGLHPSGTMYAAWAAETLPQAEAALKLP